MLHLKHLNSLIDAKGIKAKWVQQIYMTQAFTVRL